MEPNGNRSGASSSGRAGLLASRAMAHTLWALTLVLIFMGALVKSHEAGLSVPDWPTTYGQNMFLFPPSEWRANVFYEHTHRLVASLVGFLTLALCGWTMLRDGRAWVWGCAELAVVLVLLQGALGGLTVIFLLPASLSVAHGVLAQTFLLVTIFLAYVFSAERGRRSDAAADGHASAVARWAILLTGAVWVQLVLGAVMRHTESGLAIPDFPTMGGRWIPTFDATMLAWINDWRLTRTFETGINLPDVTVGQVLIHAAHRCFALAVLGVGIGLAHSAWRGRTSNSSTVRTAFGALLLLSIQIALGAATVLSAKQPLVTSLHVVVGAALLGLSWLCALQALPLQFARTKRATPDAATRVT